MSLLDDSAPLVAAGCRNADRRVEVKGGSRTGAVPPAIAPAVGNNFENGQSAKCVSSVAGARRFVALECGIDRATIPETRLRAWSGITGWRFESSSAHRERPRKQRGLSV